VSVALLEPDADTPGDSAGNGSAGTAPRAQVPDMIRQMAAGISHDFNNILTVISGFSDLLANDPGLPDRARDHLENILSASDQAARLVSRLMAFSRLQVLDRTVCSLNVIVESVFEHHRELPIDHIRFEFGLDRGLPSLRGDCELLAEAIDCIVTNAVEAMPTGGTVSVRTGMGNPTGPGVARPGRSHVHVSIGDQGVGIEPGVLGRIFDPYFTTRRTGRGMGLGLAAADGIVRQHGGWIEVDSETGRGSVFTIRLPAEEREGSGET